VSTGSLAEGGNFLFTDPLNTGFRITDGSGSTGASAAFSIFNAYTNTSNYERGVFRWNNNNLLVGTESTGTGVARNIYIETSGNVGIGTTGGNVGIGSTAPGQALDVTGTVRMTGFNLNLGSSLNNKVLTSDASGNGTWQTAAGGSSGWTVTNTNDVYETLNGNVGIGTTLTSTAALTVMNGNVGIGTWVPSGVLNVVSSGGTVLKVSGGGVDFSGSSADLSMGNRQISGTGWTINKDNGISFQVAQTNKIPLTLLGASSQTADLQQWQNSAATVLDDINASGNIGIGTFNPFGGKLIVASGNVGIGSLSPGQILDVTGTIRTTNLTMSGQSPLSGYVLTASDSAGDTTWTPPGTISTANWTITNTNDVYETLNGNVGIGTSLTKTAALTVMNGNVGIGTWAPQTVMQVVGNVGIGTFTTASTPYTLRINNTVVYNSEYNNGNSGTALTVNWNNGNKQKTTLTGNCTLTFTAPTNGVTNLALKLVQDGTGSRTVTWPGTVVWPGGTAPTLTTTATTGKDITSCYWDGTNYYCTASLDFR